MTQRIYFDHAATTPVIPEAREAMALALDVWANPSSPHGEGRDSRKALEGARQTVAEILGWRHDVIFTSGASEAVSIVGRRAAVPGRCTTTSRAATSRAAPSGVRTRTSVAVRDTTGKAVP